jgi:N-alpha-acetyl-L-2,4-diaminobutyrate deacetylase
MCVDLGSEVSTGDVIARVHNVHRNGVAPLEYYATIDGIVAGRHFPGLVQNGDSLAVIAVVVEELSG